MCQYAWYSVSPPRKHRDDIKPAPASFQALDGDFSEENRNRCRVATAPLLEAVENLSAFANNPEFASIPAQISNEVLHPF